MTARITASVQRALRRPLAASRRGVHFHLDETGRGYACFCGRGSGITLREACLTETGHRRQLR